MSGFEVLAVERPNVLFIAVDDMNDWGGFDEGYEGKVHVPNIKRLNALGMSFKHAYTASPVCCPSRTAVMLGKRPSTTGIYNNGQWWLPHLPNAISLPIAFKNSGYKGRQGIYEILVVSKPIKEAILKQATTPELRAIAIKEGFQTMQDMGRRMIANGDLNFREFERVLSAS